MSYARIIKILDQGDLKSAQEVALKNLVAEAACAGPLKRVKNPEHVFVMAFERNENIVTAVVAYGENEIHKMEIDLDECY
jgi:hypothetical protein